jgi:predicted ATPase
VQSLALQNEEAAHLGNPRVIICDRSVVDAVAYVRGQGDIEGAERLYRRVIGWLPTYHALLLLDPVGVPYETDNIRKEAMEERDRFHETFLAVFREKDIPFELISGTLRQRIRRIEEIINS